MVADADAATPNLGVLGLSRVLPSTAGFTTLLWIRVLTNKYGVQRQRVFTEARRLKIGTQFLTTDLLSQCAAQCGQSNKPDS
jgi:hypothetical protein